jgi:hypothetical protein
LTEKDIYLEYPGLLEMASIGPKLHKFGINVKLHIYQPGDKKIPHGPRIKVYSMNGSEDFSISLSNDASKINHITGASFLSDRELEFLIGKIRKHRASFMKFWNDPKMSVDDLLDELV